jgi:hypothetical protein
MFLLILTATCCDEDSICLSNQHAVQASLYSALYTTDEDTSLSDASVIGVELTDSVYANETIQDLFLPLSFTSDTTIYVIYNNTLRDTVWFSHTKELYFISGECGFSFNFHLDSVWTTHIFIDSVAIYYDEINYNESVENVKIYIF